MGVISIRLSDLIVSAIEKTGANISSFIRDAVVNKLLELDEEFVEERKNELLLEKEKLETRIRKIELELQKLEETKRELNIVLKQTMNELNKINEELSKIDSAAVIDLVKVIKVKREAMKKEIIKTFDDLPQLLSRELSRENGDVVRKIIVRLEAIAKSYNTSTEDVAKTFLEVYGDKYPQIKAIFL